MTLTRKIVFVIATFETIVFFGFAVIFVFPPFFLCWRRTTNIF
jgi:hypothetical protein